MSIKIKRFNYKNGRKTEREETERERRERLFAGHDDLAKLSKSVYESEESINDINSENKDEDKDIAESVPDNWGKLMSSDTGVQDKFKRRLEEQRKKKPMPHCNPKGGSPYHHPETGEFTSRDKAGSWSIRHPKTSKDCKAGLARMKGGGGKELFSKHADDCGREGNYICSEPDMKKGERQKGVQKENLLDHSVGVSLTPKEVEELSARLQRIQDDNPKFISSLRYLVAPFIKAAERLAERPEHSKLARQCAAAGMISFKQFLNRLNAIELAKSAELHAPPK